MHKWPAGDLPPGEFACSLNTGLGRAILLSKTASYAVITFAESTYDDELPHAAAVLKWLHDEFVRNEKLLIIPCSWASSARSILSAVPEAYVWWQTQVPNSAFYPVPKDRREEAIQALKGPGQ